MNQPSSQQEQKEQESHNSRKEEKVNKKLWNYIVFTFVAEPWHFGTYPEPYFRLTDPTPDPDPAIFANDLQKGN